MFQITIIRHVNLARDQRCVSFIQPFHIITRQFIVVPEIPRQPINFLPDSVFAFLELVHPPSFRLMADFYSFHGYIGREVQVEVCSTGQAFRQYFLSHHTPQTAALREVRILSMVKQRDATPNTQPSAVAPIVPE